MTKVIEFPAERIAKGVHSYWPELKERKISAQIEAKLCHYGNHYYLRTKLELKGQGISLVDYHQDGTNKYKVTIRAFEKLKKQYSIGIERMLD